MESDDLQRATLEIRILASVIAKLAKRDLEQRLNVHGIGALPYTIMRLLSYQDHTISELSRKMVLKSATLVPAVDALERAGLVKRGQDSKDRRRTPLSLTERGIEMLRLLPAVDSSDIVLNSLNAMGDEKRHRLLTLLRELASRMTEGEGIVDDISSFVRSLLRSEAQSVRELAARRGFDGND